MAAVRDLSTSNAVFKSVVNNKLDDHAQGAHTSSVSVYGRNIKKCMGEYIEESYIVNLYRGMSKSKLKINVNLPQLLCIVVSVALDGKTHQIAQIRHLEPQKRQYTTTEVGLHLFWALT